MSWRHTITARLISGGQRYLRRSVLDYASAVSDIKVNKEGAFGWVIFDRPERRNAMTEAMWTALPEILSTLADDPQIRVIILRGAGQDVFVSGADVSELQRARLDDSGESLETPAKSYQTHIEAALEAIATVPRPVVAMIHGWTIGAGAAIALHADLRYADDDAVFAIPAARLGLSFGIDNTKALIDVVGSAAAKEILFTGRRYEAEEARHLGVYHGVYPKAELEAEVRRVAEKLAHNAPLSIQSAKALIRQWSTPTPDHEAMSASVTRCLTSQDIQEGMRAFLEKRSPNFEGR